METNGGTMTQDNAQPHSAQTWRAEPQDDNGKLWRVVRVLDNAPGTVVTVAENLREPRARFIAAAPALLAALEELVAIAEPNIYPQPDKPNSNWAKLQRARAAIAAAKGDA